MANMADRDWFDGPDEDRGGRRDRRRREERDRDFPSEFGNYPRRESDEPRRHPDDDRFDRPRSWLSDPPRDRFFDPYANEWTRPTQIGGQPGQQREEYSERGQFSGRGPKGYKRSDERIREEVCDRLTQAGSIDASEIEVRVKEGEVTLEGTVPERRMKHLAESCAESISGVRDVTNQIRMQREDGQGSREQQAQKPNQGSGRTGSRDL